MWWTQCLVQHLTQHCSSSHVLFKNTKIKVYIRIILCVFCMGGSTKLDSEELHYLYSLPNVIRVIISRRKRWVVNAVCMERWEMHTRFWLESLRKEVVEDLGIERSMILKWIFKKQGMHRLDWSTSGYGQVAGSFECGIDHSGSIKCREFLLWLRTCCLHKKDCA